MQEQYQSIGEMAGKIYRALEQDGEQSASRLQKQLQIFDPALFNQAVGWLAREEKICFNKAGKIFTLSLIKAECCKAE